MCNFDLDELNIDDTFYARYSDYARLIVLYKFGGFWMDSTIICTKSLNWVEKIHEETNVEFIGYYAPQTANKEFPVPENWLFFALPRSKFVHDWLKETLYMNSFDSEEAYVKSVLEQYNIHNLQDFLPYLIMHLCATVNFQKNPNKYNVHLIDTMDPDHGPFKYLFYNNWELPRSLEELCRRKDLQTSLIKLRRTERRFIEKNTYKFVCKKEDVDPVIYKVLIN